MAFNPGTRLRLEPHDEFNHPIEAAQNFNESMYFNLFDPAQRVGGWFRVGNRPNEGYAEMSICLYFPDGTAGFMFGRPAITHNDAFSAGGMTMEVVEPFKTMRVTYAGEVIKMTDPLILADPRRAFKECPRVPVELHIDYRGTAPMWGGEAVNADGSAIEEKPGEAFARAHYEQHIAGKGTLKVGDETWTMEGYGLRDHSWGPRYWQNIHWYRWLPMSFGEDFAAMISVIARTDGSFRRGGMVLENGKYTDFVDARVEPVWDENYYQTGFKAWAKTEEKEYHFEGKVLTMVPLRNRRKDEAGNEMMTRITEGMTEYRCGDRVGYGLSEFLDQVVDGIPVGADET